MLYLHYRYVILKGASGAFNSYIYILLHRTSVSGISVRQKLVPHAQSKGSLAYECDLSMYPLNSSYMLAVLPGHRLNTVQQHAC